MEKQSIKVLIGREVQLISPGVLGRKFDFQPGYSFHTKEWFYPGELFETGTLVGTPRDQWSFGTNTGSDLPLSFASEDVSEVTISGDSETTNVFKNAPFKVSIQCQ